MLHAELLYAGLRKEIRELRYGIRQPGKVLYDQRRGHLKSVVRLDSILAL